MKFDNKTRVRFIWAACVVAVLMDGREPEPHVAAQQAFVFVGQLLADFATYLENSNA